ncbi:MAG: F0F1 ATP synthase subunit delta [Nitrosomonas sp.]|jgi:F-type H+-transporting ATPase subunit delta|uniref:F0F1 ATP synthase subunit delta n=1 Tax=Nitrosomonas sp. TaxID=42353 RepID=UPI001DD1AC71|nr:F0F1 ATP synthase subunit delta [Nitrosomonas sp.]MBX9893583.1 F0F1 ATP synthase subunit delta [Nitrosomonas sp.]
MAEAITVARPYAEAVFRLALESKDLSQWSKILQIAAEIAQDDQIKLLVGNPLVSAMQLSELILEIGGKKFTREACNFIKLMVENKRMHVMPQVMELFEQLKAQHEGVLEAKIITAFKLEGGQLNKLVTDLEKKFNRKVEAQVSVDPEIIGGVKVEIGDEIFDASVRGKLEAMTIALKS